MPDEFDPLPIIARLSAAAPGPWDWYGSTDNDTVTLATTHSGRIYVLAFDRLGLNRAAPRFTGWRGRVRDNLRRFVRYEVLGYRTREEAGIDLEAAAHNSPLYREDFRGIAHPDAELIAHAPADIAALLGEVRRQGTIIDEACQLLHAIAESPAAARRQAAGAALERIATVATATTGVAV